MTLINFEYLSFESYVHSQNRNSFALDCPLNGRSVSLSQISIVKKDKTKSNYIIIQKPMVLPITRIEVFVYE